MHVVQQEDALLRPGQELRHGRGLKARALQATREPLAVLLRLQRPHHPGAHVGEALVVEVHGVLGGEHDAHPLRARLLEQGEQRRAWWAGWRGAAGSSRRSRPCRRGAQLAGAALRRIQVFTLSTSSAVTKSRSASARWATRDDRRPGARRGRACMRATSSGSPRRHAANVGEASRLLRAIMRPWRSLRGKAVSRGRAPILSNGGSAIAPMRLSRSRPLPARQLCSIRLARKTAGGDCSGSASTRTRPRSPDTIDWISSRRSSSAESKATEGASSDCSTFSGTPALDPGVKMTASCACFRAAMSFAPRPQSARPFFHEAAASARGGLHVLPVAPRRLGVDPRLEGGGVEPVEEQQQVREVALRVDRDHRDALAQRAPR